MIGSGGGRWDAPLKSTVRAQNTIKLNCAMNDSFFFIYFLSRTFFGALGARDLLSALCETAYARAQIFSMQEKPCFETNIIATFTTRKLSQLECFISIHIRKQNSK